MHPSLTPWIGKKVRLTMRAGAPWYGHKLVGVFEPAPESAPEGSVKMVHARAGDVILLPAAVAHIAQAKATE